ncbi:4-hydroxy-2-oxoheptanedioate aldolase [Candidatus Magnetomoraceae bacterium gMMP-15]
MNLKQKFQNQQITIGSWITIGSTVVAEIMAHAGYDWLAVDIEHSAITLDTAQDLIRVIELCGVTPLVRVAQNEPNIIKKVMDAGSHGVIVPMVNSGEEAERAVKSVKYPPEGFRGVGLARAQKYGADFEGYKAWLSKNSIVIVQIEHIQAVDNLEDILSISGVDGFLVGPYDLSGSLGVPGQFDHPEFLESLNKIKTISKKMNAISGFHVISPDVQDFQNKVKEGYKFIGHSLDILFLGNKCRNTLKEIQELKNA